MQPRTVLSLEQALSLQPELVIFGSGPRLRFVSPALLRCLIERRVGVETMDTAAAITAAICGPTAVATFCAPNGMRVAGLPAWAARAASSSAMALHKVDCTSALRAGSSSRGKTR